MPRVRSNVARLKRKKQIMKAARGAFGARSKLWKSAKENVERGWAYAYRDRKVLADIAVRDAAAFGTLAETARKALTVAA